MVRWSSLVAVVVGCTACRMDESPDPALVDRVRACARLVCLDFTDSSAGGGIDGCISYLPSRLVPCVLAAEGCDEASRCLGAGSPPESCSFGFREDYCRGEARVSCHRGLTLAEDCAERGLECSDTAEGARCTRPGGCSMDSCDGDVPILCEAGWQVPIDCGGGVCVETTDGVVCSGDGEPCVEGERYCDGDVSRFCSAGRFREQICAPGRCGPDEDGFERCLPNPTCDDLPRCQGDTIVACVGQVVVRADCTEFGDFECVEETSARCALPGR